MRSSLTALRKLDLHDVFFAQQSTGTDVLPSVFGSIILPRPGGTENRSTSFTEYGESASSYPYLNEIHHIFFKLMHISQLFLSYNNSHIIPVFPEFPVADNPEEGRIMLTSG